VVNIGDRYYKEGGGDPMSLSGRFGLGVGLTFGIQWIHGSMRENDNRGQPNSELDGLDCEEGDCEWRAKGVRLKARLKRAICTRNGTRRGTRRTAIFLPREGQILLFSLPRHSQRRLCRSYTPIR
jgi:hypothetical protein